MADASFVQDSFLGGEWSPFAQGHITDPRYRSGMATCRNAYPIETGAWVRRVGTRWLATTRQGRAAKLIPFNFSQDAPYEMEFTDGKLRFHNKDGLVLAEEPRRVTAISTATPAKVTTFEDPTTWHDGDCVVFLFPGNGASTMASALLGRQFFVTHVTDNLHFTLVDSVTGQPLNGSTFFFDSKINCQLARVLELTTPYTGALWEQLTWSQNEDTVLLFHPNMRPYSVQGAGNCSQNVFQINPAYFVDGPYLDPYTDGSFLTSSALTGQITLTLGYPAYASGTTYPNGSVFKPKGQVISGDNSGVGSGATIGLSPQYVAGSIVRASSVDYVSIANNNAGNTPASSPSKWQALAAGAVVSPNGFQASDIGRLIRLNSEPSDWTATTYAAAAVVKYQDAYWVASVAAAATDIPGQNPLVWGIASNASSWTWGVIVAAPSAISLTVQIIGPDLLYNNTVRLWRLGAWSDSTAWPTCGTYHEGRFWIGGAIKNRFDATMATQPFNMAPTAIDGTVADDNAISYLFDSPDQNQIVWMIPEEGGIVAGTAGGEWLISASQLSDPLTPTSIQAHRRTKFGCASVLPMKTPTTVVFVQRQGLSVFEYYVDAWFGRAVGSHLSLDAKNLLSSGVKEIAFQQELTPTVWARCGDGSLVGCCYKREQIISSQPPTFVGWHKHTLGSGRLITSLVSGPSPDGLTTTVSMVTHDPVTKLYNIEQLTQAQAEDATQFNSWFLDSATNPKGASVTTQNGQPGVLLSGLWSVNNQTVTAYIAGLDLGEFTVSNGGIFVPFTAAFTQDYLQIVSQNGADYQDIVTPVVIPVGFPAQKVQMMLEPHQFTDQSYLSSRNWGILDAPRGQFYIPLAGNGPDSGLASFDAVTGELVKFSRNAELWGLPIPEDWDATISYQTAPQVLAVDAHIYASSIDGNTGIDPTTDNGVHWTDAGGIPGGWDTAVTYILGARVTTSQGFVYFQAKSNLAGSRDPLADDGTQWAQLASYGGPTPPTWSGALTFPEGTVVQRENIGAIFVSLQNSNTANAPGSSPTWWQNLGPLPLHWNAGTAYQATVQVTGSNGHQYANLADNNLDIDPTSDGGIHWENLNSGPARGAGGPDWTLGFDGFLYTYPDGYISKIDPTTLVEIAAGSTAIDPYQMAGVTAGSRNYLIATQDGTPASIGIFDTDGMKDHPLSGTFMVDEGQRGRVVSAPPHCECGCTGRAIVLGINYISYTDGETVGLYTLDISADDVLVWNKSGVIAPTDLDSDWVKFQVADGMAIDQTDGNPILIFQEAGTPAHPAYIVKVDANTAKIIWKVATGGANNATGMKFSNIAHQEYATINPDGNAYVINTVDGSFQVIALGGTFTAVGSACYNDVNGTILSQVEFAQSDGLPILGPGTVAPFTQYCTFTIGRPNTVYSVPGVVGFTYTSQGQVLPPMRPEEAGTRNGPALGKNQRSHMFGMMLFNTTTAVSVGTTFDKMRPLKLTNKRGDAYSPNQLYSDTFWDTLEDTYSFSSKLAWSISRPYPATVLAITQFLHTQDR